MAQSKRRKVHESKSKEVSPGKKNDDLCALCRVCSVVLQFYSASRVQQMALDRCTVLPISNKYFAIPLVWVLQVD